ncbi:hypothetical protein [Fusibacter sp. 3D3]|uniref:hypothetical protein n=1 Tax=Fusibacter sp. 3D3 TaxID=1048380 RepID=UPI000853D310|nr:hypothetical protein [Fusibacter sp. 3D3]GAU77650.1 hypothetical protein F3D3_2279 [Fusibacter sp. 3D3]
MENNTNKCQRCGNEILNQVLYKCVRCFTAYCISCEDSNEGRCCPKCGMGARMILDQTPSKKEEEA